MLPRLLLITDRTQAAGPLATVVAQAVDRGVRGVVLRDRTWGYAARLGLARQLAPLLAAVDGTLIIAGPQLSGTDSPSPPPDPPADAAPALFDGVHLAAADAFPDPRPRLVGRSCHSAAELASAAAEGCDYAFLSPIYPTASKPGYGPALGAPALAAWRPPALPVYALGGVLPEHVAQCRRAGAYGIAVMGPAMRDPGIVPAYLAALSSEES